MSDYDATPTDKVHRLVQQAEANAAGASRHPAQGRPLIVMTPVGFLAALTPDEPDERLFECSYCGAVVSVDGCDVHAAWHQLREVEL